MRSTLATLLAASALLVLTVSVADAGKAVSADCKAKGFKLQGKVKFVEHFPDLKIEIVEHFPDLKVQKVEHFPDKCGKWQVVEHFPDIEVQIVEHFGDLKVQYVQHFPGLP